MASAAGRWARKVEPHATHSVTRLETLLGFERNTLSFTAAAVELDGLNLDAGGGGWWIDTHVEDAGLIGQLYADLLPLGADGQVEGGGLSGRSLS